MGLIMEISIGQDITSADTYDQYFALISIWRIHASCGSRIDEISCSEAEGISNEYFESKASARQLQTS